MEKERMGKEECYQEFQQKKLETEPESKKIKRIHGGVDEDLSNKHPLYRDVQMRNWGKWVSEIREPWKKSRIWLGTFPTPEMAVWAHNVATLSIKGSAAILNFLHFANSLPCPTSLTPQDVQAAAAKVVHMDPSSLSSLVIKFYHCRVKKMQCFPVNHSDVDTRQSTSEVNGQRSIGTFRTNFA
ncbi:Dehydration-responsive element-binding protein 3 [Glycine soja]